VAGRSSSEPDPGGQAGRGTPGIDERLAADRTKMAWTRTALAFGAVGGIILRTSVVPGIVVLATSPLIYVLGILARPDAEAKHAAGRLRLVSASIIVVALVALAVSVFAHGRH
jgi:uncharacterized membrane protein YidH (DUF202 family)